MTPRLSLGTFRFACAAYIRYLMRARLAADPQAFDAETLAKWQIQNHARDRAPVAQLLRGAMDAISRISCSEHAWMQGDWDDPLLIRFSSGGIEFIEDCDCDPRWNDARHHIAFFVGDVGRTLPLLVAAAEAGEAVDWERMDWQRLPEIRVALDALPQPTTEELRAAAEANTEPVAAATVTTTPGQPSGVAVRVDKATAAMALLVHHPEWTDAKIAKEVGCDRSYLSRHKDYKKLRRDMRRQLRQGTKYNGRADAPVCDEHDEIDR